MSWAGLATGAWKEGGLLLGRLVEVGQGRVRVRPLGGNRAGEVRLGRFLHNPRVTPAEMIVAGVTRTAGQVYGYYGKPGPVVILQGLLRFKAMRHGWALRRLA